VPDPGERRGPIAKTIRTQICVDAGMPRVRSQTNNPHHLRFAQPRALGCKVSDEFTVPVVASVTMNYISGLNVDPVPAALALWRRSHPIATSLQGGHDEN
jgi:hypothetical protein